jgi:hypothetical protein
MTNGNHAVDTLLTKKQKRDKKSAGVCTKPLDVCTNADERNI